MANVNTTVSATGDYIVGFDSDSDGSANKFTVQRNTSGTPKDLLSVDGDAQVRVMPPVSATTSPFKIVNSAGSTLAEITLAGKADFSTGGIRTKVQAAAPSGGSDGDLILQYSAGTYKLWAKANGTWVSVRLV